jgi:Reverse transcriptase (RNA-dependent DNA polymerase)/Integrase core domain/GAG-pre-integrase domain
MDMEVPNGSQASKVKLTDVLHVPQAGYTLVSVGQLDKAGYTVTFGGRKCVLTGPDGRKVGAIPMTEQGLYKVTNHVSEEIAGVAEETLTLDLFHRRMGHISPSSARSLVQNKMVTGVKLDVSSLNATVFCESCVHAKATRKPIPKVREGERAKSFGDEIHSDLWGPAPVETKGGKRYYITFTDDATRLTHMFLLRAKSDAFDAYKKYDAWCQTQFDVRIKTLHSDRGGEFMGKEFVSYLKERGTKQKLTVHDSPAQNGVAERRNRTILERIRALLHASGLPRNLWGEAARHVIWLMNRTSTKAVEGKTPFEAVFEKKPNLKDVREWGERVYVRTEDGNKLGGRVNEGCWLGIDEQSKGARVYWREKQSVTVERNVYYNNMAPSTTQNEGEEDDGTVIPKVDVPIARNAAPANDQPNPDIPPMPEPYNPPAPPAEPTDEIRAKRIRKPSQRVLDIIEGRATTSARQTSTQIPRGVQLPSQVPENLHQNEGAELEGEGQAEYIMSAENYDGYALAAEISEAEGLEPRSFAEAQRRPDWPLWETAINDELETLKRNGTWELTSAPDGANIIGSKWVFRAKKDAAGNVVRYKARLVAQGFSQVPGVDYFDTFAPVARLASIRAVLAMAADLDLELHQIDIKSAYLNGELTSNEQIYMRQPPGYHDHDAPKMVCRLSKAIYGIKQAGRRWYQKLCEIMVKKIGYARCDVDMAVFYWRRDKEFVVVLVNVDDCSIAATSVRLISALKAGIAKHVEITDLGELHWLLGLEIRRDRSRRIIQLSQKSYIESIIRRYGFQDLKPVSIPMDANTRYTTAQSPSTTAEYAAMRDVPYHEAIGSAMYAAIATRPDIAFAIQTVSRFSTNPGPAHWEAVKKIFRYLKGTANLWLTYGEKGTTLAGYSDADGSMGEDRRAVSGYAFIINGGAVSWSAKRQEIISLSTTESEYIAVTHASKEALWLRSLVQQLFNIKLDATTLFCDNKSAIELTKDHQYHARTKHIDIRYHFIRWIVEQNSIKIIYCPTNEMLADALTKALPSAKVKHFAVQFGLLTA